VISGSGQQHVARHGSRPHDTLCLSVLLSLFPQPFSLSRLPPTLLLFTESLESLVHSPPKQLLRQLLLSSRSNKHSILVTHKLPNAEANPRTGYPGISIRTLTSGPTYARASNIQSSATWRIHQHQAHKALCTSLLHIHPGRQEFLDKLGDWSIDTADPRLPFQRLAPLINPISVRLGVKGVITIARQASERRTAQHLPKASSELRIHPYFWFPSRPTASVAKSFTSGHRLGTA
jgi:hypothetical protein